ncbi:hypothetical protein [Shewanella nanhaiensis]|uniref:Lipoprotein n=1 Tax=Shewanella nanhaiensis TaxID=2864872 RepID=A0ABS7EAQ6_9GAMM|nr:hypothetical protein [Shewanella nanhaiensis]MBW8186655.1 hypothetical protein [Shewanella nanhaiensis]
MWKYSPLVMATLLLTACGGGGSDEETTPVTPPTPPSLTLCEQATELNVITTSSRLEFVVEQNYFAQQTAAIIARLNDRDSAGLNFTWQQVSGPSLILKSIKSPVLAFELLETGSYSFSVNVKSANLDLTETIELTVNDASTSMLKVRSDHQVVEGNNASFRIDRVGANNDQQPSNISWCIASGPELNLDTQTPERPQFKAPNVNSDTISILRVTGTVSGETISEEVLSLITNESAITSQYFDEPVARTFAYKANSTYASALESCIYSNQLTSPCSTNTLPLLGQVPGSTDKEKIMDRLLVSHQWMGENFETFIEQMDPNSDFATLLQSVTAVVISYDVRPSFYWVVTGAIYLDPSDLWLLAQERDVINEAPDFRSNFGNELGFIMPWRYIKNNDYVSYITARATRTDRSLAELSPDLSSLLYHELAHANDFFPSSTHSSLGIDNQTLLDHFEQRSENKELISDKVTSRFPLTSDEMSSLATVSFRGETASNTQKNYQPSDITLFFSNDIASDYYAYSSTREDTAMLFEEAMMSHRYGILRDVGVTDRPENITAATITVDWGQRGRIGQNSLQSRAAFVIHNIFPNMDGTNLISHLPEPIAMTQGDSWLENLTISTLSNAQKRAATQQSSSTTPLSVPELRISGDRHKLVD